MIDRKLSALHLGCLVTTGDRMDISNLSQQSFPGRVIQPEHSQLRGLSQGAARILFRSAIRTWLSVIRDPSH